MEKNKEKNVEMENITTPMKLEDIRVPEYAYFKIEVVLVNTAVRDRFVSFGQDDYDRLIVFARNLKAIYLDARIEVSFKNLKFIQH